MNASCYHRQFRHGTYYVRLATLRMRFAQFRTALLLPLVRIVERHAHEFAMLAERIAS